MKYFLFLSIILSSTIYAQYQIGHTTITFNDPSRTDGFGSGGGAGRQIQTEIYYPAISTGENTTIIDETFPIVVFGHGFAMSWDAYANIWEHYVSRGYIVAFPRTEGSLFPSPVHQDFGLDLRLVSEKLLALNAESSSPFFGKMIEKSAIIGHSMGGGASILAAANNTGIATVVGLAPAETDPSAIAEAGNVSVPALIFSGSSDGVTPPNDHHVPIYNALNSACKSFVSIEGGAHCYFANTNFNCDFGESTSSTGISITREEQQNTTYSILDPWLDYKLKGICEAYEAFLLAMENQPGTTTETTCSQVPSVTLFNDVNQGFGVWCSDQLGVSYQWYFDNQPLEGETNDCKNIPVDLGGTYQLAVYFDEGCSMSNSISFVSGLVDDILPSIQIFPNPILNQLYVQSSIVINSIKIFSINGELVDSKIDFLNGVFDLSCFQKGIYLIEVKQGQDLIYKRIVKT